MNTKSEKKLMKPYNEVIKRTVQETHSKAKLTQLTLDTEYGYTITTCIIHAHFINMARPGTYEVTLNKMLKANRLLLVVVPGEVPSEYVFGAKMAATVRVAVSQESVATGASGF